MTRIFISYRRGDSELFTGRLADHLRGHFGEQAVFHDIDSIPFGVDFRDHISAVIRQCDVLLAVIGKDWLTADEKGKRRIDEARDFVRIEIESALEAGLIVIPVLAGDANMPDENELPASIGKLAYLNAAQIDTGRDFKVHTERLVQGVKTLPILKPPFPAAAKSTPSTPAKVIPPPCRLRRHPRNCRQRNRHLSNPRKILPESSFVTLLTDQNWWYCRAVLSRWARPRACLASARSAATTSVRNAG
ncbi:MAG: hypothetical protein H6R18_613 [Proteobacteria bacterium]|nr:hypothetical protein [Pseudomonadota bacterium]